MFHSAYKKGTEKVVIGSGRLDTNYCQILG